MTENALPAQTQPLVATAPPAYGTAPVPVAPAYPVAPGQHVAPGQLGKVRSTGVCILLSVVTFGIYAAVWTYKVHSEMKAHTGQGLGGGPGADDSDPSASARRDRAPGRRVDHFDHGYVVPLTSIAQHGG